VLRILLAASVALACSCAPPVSHTYPKSLVRTEELAGAWHAVLRGKSFLTKSAEEVVLTGHGGLTLDRDGSFVYAFVEEPGARRSEVRGLWSQCLRSVGDESSLQCVCLDSLRLLPGASGEMSEATRVPFLVIEGDTHRNRDTRDLLLCDPNEDRMICFSR
jgi:hypothetical protein